jgi:hypothetical protein
MSPILSGIRNSCFERSLNPRSADIDNRFSKFNERSGWFPFQLLKSNPSHRLGGGDKEMAAAVPARVPVADQPKVRFV